MRPELLEFDIDVNCELIIIICGTIEMQVVLLLGAGYPKFMRKSYDTPLSTRNRHREG